jgi:hypothetical protein
MKKVNECVSIFLNAYNHIKWKWLKSFELNHIKICKYWHDSHQVRRKTSCELRVSDEFPSYRHPFCDGNKSYKIVLQLVFSCLLHLESIGSKIFGPGPNELYLQPTLQNDLLYRTDSLDFQNHIYWCLTACSFSKLFIHKSKTYLSLIRWQFLFLSLFLFFKKNTGFKYIYTHKELFLTVSEKNCINLSRW